MDPTTPKAAAKDAIKAYAISHGLLRGGTTKEDKVPDSKPLTLDEDDDDEGLRVFTQNTTCRRKLCASVFDSEDLISGTVSHLAADFYESLTLLICLRHQEHYQ